MTTTELARTTDEDTKASLIKAALTPGVTLDELFARFGGGLVPQAPKAKSVDVPPLAEGLVERATKAVETAAELYGKVAAKDGRALSGEELKDLFAEREAIDALLTAVGAFKLRKEQGIRHTAANHLDRVAELAGTVRPEPADDKPATERDANGHYLVETEAAIPGTGKVFRWEIRGGEVRLDGERLLEALEAGEITRQQYLSITREVRVPDEAKTKKAIAADPTLFPVLSKHATTVSPRTGALYVRKESS